MFTHLGNFTVRRHRLVLAGTVLFLVIAVVLGARVFGSLQGGGFDDPDSESSRAHATLVHDFGAADANMVVLVTAASGDVDDPSVAAAAEELTRDLSAEPGVSQLTSYWSSGAPQMRSIDGTKALIVGRINGSDTEIEDRFADIRDDYDGDRGAIVVGFGGETAINADMNSTIEGDLAKAESIAVPLTIVLLVLVFGGLVAAGLPLFVALIAVPGTLLSLFVISQVTDVSVYSINLTTALGLGLAIDYSLFIVNRFREELDDGLTVERAVVRTVETAGRTVAFSALTVAASLVALLAFPLYFLRSFAYAGTSVVIVAALGSVVSLPALLAVVGTRVNSLRIFRRRRAPKAEVDGFWHRLAGVVMRRPIVIAASVVAVLVVIGLPFARADFGLPGFEALPSSSPARQVSEALVDEFDGNSAGSFAVVITGVDPAAATVEIDALAAEVSDVAGVARVDGLTGTYVEGRLVTAADPTAERYRQDRGTWLTVTPSVNPRSAAGEALVRDIRNIATPLHIGVEGQAAQLVDTKAAITDALPLALAIIAGVTFVLLFLVFGSVLVPVKAILLNLLSLSATFGAMVWVFQDGHLSGLLGFTATGQIDISMPILMFCIAFGLSMDYEVFLLSRIKEEHDRTGDNRRAVAMGLERTGRIVTAAAALLAITFLAFGTGGVSFMKMFGIGLTLAVVMDATIIRGLLVPAFMRLAGEANWWAPRWMRRIHDRVGLSEGETPHPAPVAVPTSAAWAIAPGGMEPAHHDA